ncbi:ABC transporter permease [Psychromonas sp. SA13A]|uniref:ABC transporter permease n=1 Tax=Psychromonas sp. SA13A TaxID=2686346 RepID=UPI0014086039|nr:ABC transporter permease [Psychromonas sp. SA13A]
MWLLKNIPNRELILFFVITSLIFSLFSSTFRSAGNVENILIGFSHLGILAIGQALPILMRGIDLSVGSILALVGMVMFDCYIIFHMPGYVVLPIAIAVGTMAGVINGILITRFRIQPFITTLATMAAYRGLTYAISGRQLVPESATQAIDDNLLGLFDEFSGIFPYSFFLLLIVLAAAQYILSRTRIGLDLYSIGGNPEAARLCGIKVDKMIIISYGFSGFCAALAAIVMVSRMTTSTENLGIGIELTAITAAVIGGISLQGGIGNAIGPVIGAFLMGVILVGLTLTGISTYAQPVITGVILIAAVSYDRYKYYKLRSKNSAGESA